MNKPSLAQVDGSQAGAWLTGRINSPDGTVGCIVPSGFERYARVRHSAMESPGILPLPQLARLASHAQSFTAGQQCLIALWNGWAWLHGAPMNLSLSETKHASAEQRIRKAGPARRRSGIRARLRDVERGDKLLRLPSREYQVYAGTLNDVVALPGKSTDGVPSSPNLWWPTDSSWIVATDIDLVETFVGGPAAFVDRCIADTELQATAVELGEPVEP